jgi:hypothetical protein
MPTRDVPELERALRGHSVRGYPVRVPVFGDAVVENSTLILGAISYRVRLARPLAFGKVAEAFLWSVSKNNLEGWYEELKDQIARSPHIEDRFLRVEAMLPPEIFALLETGGRASWQDVHRTWLERAGCLDKRNRVVCFSFDSQHVEIPPESLTSGMLVEFADRGGVSGGPRAGWAGRVVGSRTDPEYGPIVLVELFEPVPFVDGPESWAPWEIRPGFHSSKTFALGYGTVDVYRLSGTPLPPGGFDPDKRNKYILDEPMDLSIVERLCRENYPDEPICFQQSMIMYILPLVPRRDPKGRFEGGMFRPLPEQAVRAGEIQVWGVEQFTGPEL